MEYIPESRIWFITPNELMFLPFPQELILHIHSYFDNCMSMKYASKNVEKFWINLGIETANLCRLYSYCCQILSHPLACYKTVLKAIVFDHERLNILRGHLYELFTLNENLDYDIYRSMEPFHVAICNTFYVYNSFDYPVDYSRNKPYQLDTIRVQDKEFITEFNRRLWIFLDYIKKNVWQFPISHGGFVTNTTIVKRKKTILNIIRQLEITKEYLPRELEGLVGVNE